MTKTLTEQWRNEELPNGNYYTICSGWNMQTFPCIVYCERNCFGANVIEVLAPVPSYDKVTEMSQKIERLEFDNEALEMAHNECKEINAELVSKTEQLEKQLAIATKALKEYDNKLNWDIRGVSFMKYNKGFTIARKALKEMEGVK